MSLSLFPDMSSDFKIFSLRIVPQNPVFNEINEFKKEFEVLYGKQLLSGSKPHITIVEFEMDVQYLDSLVRVFDELSNIEKFNLDIESFNVFENNSKALYLKISKTEEISKLLSKITEFWTRDLNRKKSTLLKSSTPHITISKAANLNMLYESLAFFKEKDYCREFEVSQLELTSRYAGKTWDWKHQIKLSQKEKLSIDC